MVRSKHYREITETVYEKGKDDRVMPTDMQRLGIYTLRLMMPPDAIVFCLRDTRCYYLSPAELV
jgi:hypothetical protein